MTKIDTDRFIVSMIQQLKDGHPLRVNILYALLNQGLIYTGDSIVRVVNKKDGKSLEEAITNEPIIAREHDIDMKAMVDKCNGCNNVKGCITCVDGSEYEEPVSEDLEAEIKRYVYDPYFNLNGVAVKGATEYLTVEDVADIARHFANWQKQQMMKDAVDGRFSYNPNFKENEFICLEKSDTPEHYIGELVKVIIIKEEE